MSYWINEKWTELEYFIFLIKLKGWVLFFENSFIPKKKKPTKFPIPNPSLPLTPVVTHVCNVTSLFCVLLIIQVNA